MFEYIFMLYHSHGYLQNATASQASIEAAVLVSVFSSMLGYRSQSRAIMQETKHTLAVLSTLAGQEEKLVWTDWKYMTPLGCQFSDYSPLAASSLKMISLETISSKSYALVCLSIPVDLCSPFRFYYLGDFTKCTMGLHRSSGWSKSDHISMSGVCLLYLCTTYMDVSIPEERTTMPGVYIKPPSVGGDILASSYSGHALWCEFR
ncbi:hypothetical protein B0H66DRAFT_210107 [Apodospora peruviana]|uniref:Uncharacterized protein n=1 Tax=Apodospora peruviana TaxID=516989 RepID=A0AAE0M970_9PEZI|nr:hypothetical protein B0H66DRAFT_210107 [Apodospora peruviana]